MSRPVGVTASAVVAMLWSILTVLMGAAVVASVFIEPQQAQPPNSTQFALAGAAFMAALGGFGIWTSIGLFRLRSWARISILVFAGFTAVWSIFGFLMTRIVPVPPEMTAGGLRIFRLAMGAMFGIPLLITVWWLIQFNTPSTKAAFASSPLPDTVPARPLSITVIGWISILGILSCLVMILTHQPAFLLGATFTGWTAIVCYVFFGALSLYIGKGLLDLNERARVVALGWFGLMFVQMGLVALVPSIRQRVLELQRAVAPTQPTQIPIDQNVLMSATFAFTGIFMAAAIWFLVRNRPAFLTPFPAPVSLGEEQQ